MTDRAHMPKIEVPNLLCYEDLRRAGRCRYEWPEFDENSACRAVLHLGHHRQSQGRAVLAPLDGAAHVRRPACRTCSACRRATCVLPVVPMFHVNAWGMPYFAAR